MTGALRTVDEGQVCAHARPAARRGQEGGPSGAADLLWLQRTAGNHAAASILTGRRPGLQGTAVQARSPRRTLARAPESLADLEATRAEIMRAIQDKLVEAKTFVEEVTRTPVRGGHRLRQRLTNALRNLANPRNQTQVGESAREILRTLDQLDEQLRVVQSEIGARGALGGPPGGGGPGGGGAPSGGQGGAGDARSGGSSGAGDASGQGRGQPSGEAFGKQEKPAAPGAGKPEPGKPATGAKPSASTPARSPIVINRASVLRLGGNVLVMVAFWFLASKLAKLEQDRIERRFQTKIDPHIETGLAKLAAEAQRLYVEKPTAAVYLHNTIEVRWYQVTSPYGDVKIGFNDVEHVGPVMASREKVADERIVDHYSGDAGMGILATYYTSRVTYSLPLQFDEPAEQRGARVMAYEAGQDAEAGRSARRRAEQYERLSTGDPSDTEDPADRAAGIKAWKIRWAQAYLEYTKGRAHLKELRIDALRYLDELEGRASPARDSIVTPPLDPAGRKQLEEWMRRSG